MSSVTDDKKPDKEDLIQAFCQSLIAKRIQCIHQQSQYEYMAFHASIAELSNPRTPTQNHSSLDQTKF